MYQSCLTFLWLMASAGLVGCSDNPLEQLPDEELSQQYRLCRQQRPDSYPEIMVCDNIQRECERRAVERERVCERE